MCYSTPLGFTSPAETFMPTTTIRMPDDLKTRVSAAARQSGTTPHGFMLEAIAEKAEPAELCAQFDTVAEERYAMNRRLRQNDFPGNNARLSGTATGRQVRQASGRPKIGALRCRASNWHRRWGTILSESSTTSPSTRSKIRICAFGK